MIWFDEKSTLKLQAGDDSRAAKLDQKINADESISELEARVALAEQALAAKRAGPALAYA